MQKLYLHIILKEYFYPHLDVTVRSPSRGPGYGPMATPLPCAGPAQCLSVLGNSGRVATRQDLAQNVGRENFGRKIYTVRDIGNLS